MADIYSGLMNYAASTSQMLMGHSLNEQSAGAADRRTRNLFADIYSPQARVKQLQEAGLSVGLMYGGAGAGGQNVAGAQAASAPNAGHDYFNILGMELQKAQIENIKAETREKNANADVTETTGTEQARADIAQKLADAGHKEAAKALTDMQTNWQRLQNAIGEATAQFDIEKAMHSASQLYEETQKIAAEARSAKIHADVDEESKQEYIKQKKLDTESMLKQLQLNDAQIESLYAHIGIDKELKNIKRFEAQTDYNKLQEQVKQWAVQNGLVEQGQETEKQNNAISSISHIVGSLIILGGMIYPPTRAAASMGAGLWLPTSMNMQGLGNYSYR